MGKINKDKFENYLRENVPNDGPSGDLFKKLQKEAVWHQSTSVVKSSKAIKVILVIVGLFLIGTYLIHYTNIPKQVAPVTTKIPVFEELTPEPSNVIAANDDFEEIGIYKLVRYKSDDFNLSFEEDISQGLELKASGELSSI